MSETTTTTTTEGTMTETQIAEFVAWQGTDADALAPILTDQVEPEPEEDREPQPELPWIPGYASEDYSDEDPYTDEYDRFLEDRDQERIESR